MFYRPDIDEVIKRYKKFYQANAQGEKGHLLIQTYGMNGWLPYPTVLLTKYNYETQLETYLDELINLLEQHLRMRLDEGMFDDTIPHSGVIPFGAGIFPSVFGAEIQFKETTSWAEPIIKNWKELDSLKVKNNNPWLKRLMRTAKYMAKKAKGRFGLVPEWHGPTDLAGQLRGSELYTDFYDNPARVHELLDLCADTIISIFKRYKKIIGDCYSGTVGGAGCWLPGNSINMSNDADELASANIFQDFAREYYQRIIDAFDGAYIHSHSYGMHLIPEFAKLRNLYVLEINRDPNQEPPISLLGKEGGTTVPLHIDCTAEELKAHIDKVSSFGNIMFLVGARNRDEARESINLVREYSK